MIRVLHIVYVMDRGGLETSIMDLYRNIERSKIQFDFLVHTEKKGDYDDEIYSLGGQIFYVVPRNKGIIANRKSLDNFFKKHSDYKIVHAHASSLSYLEPLIYAKKYKIPVRILHSRSTNENGRFIHKYLHTLNRIFLKKIATNYFACSDLAAVWMFGRKMTNENKCVIIKNARNIDEFIYNPIIRNIKRDELALKDKFVIGHVGRFTEAKNHMFLINVFKEIRKAYIDSVLILVGDGNLRHEIETKIKQLNLQDNVMLLGVRSDISDLLQTFDVFLFPSLWEGLPGTVVEAQSSGLPCVISNTITKQVKASDLLEFVSLKESAKYWADKVLSYNSGYERKDMRNEMVKSGFDIKESTKWLQKFYSESIKQ